MEDGLEDRVDITLTDKRTGTIAPELFGCLIENYGTLLDGIWVGEESSIPNAEGLRLEATQGILSSAIQ